DTDRPPRDCGRAVRAAGAPRRRDDRRDAGAGRLAHGDAARPRRSDDRAAVEEERRRDRLDQARGGDLQPRAWVQSVARGDGDHAERRAHDLARSIRGRRNARRARHAGRRRRRPLDRHRRGPPAPCRGAARESPRDGVGRLPAWRATRRGRATGAVVSAAARETRSAASPARVLATRVLERVETDAAFADLVLEVETGRLRVPPRDVGLATELVYGTLRWQRYLDWIVTPHSRRPIDALDPRVRVILRMTAYQLVFLARVPAFAAVNDAVTLARAGARGAAEYTHAVLRAFARRGAREREPAPPREPIDALATRCSFPTWLPARWVARHGIVAAAALMRGVNERPPRRGAPTTLRPCG